ncbi:bifunctional DNA primase/polymerase [Sinorhizobium meliloti]|uniref:bifunctional DNA primase/polymerase n=1 Tax=Rhizobium meliloti TaxID=382 RepID=UPI0020735988|nr:bifunctional DNA primase/polymerase [Sinorhizobium meliloti]MCM5691440.1 bifunctional DNA primase/polymerase [Sinorhizobium meliloti]
MTAAAQPEPITANLSVALAYIAAGIPVFPCRARTETDPHTGEVDDPKSPLTQNGFKDASTRENIVRRWWSDNPEALVGIPTGAKTGFFALDVDVKEGKTGDINLATMEAEHTPLPPTVVVQTATGGLHFLFRHVDGLTNSTGSLPADIDVRAQGGFVIAAGSAFPDGSRYEFLEAHTPGDFTKGIATAPEWLVDVIRTPKYKPADNAPMPRADNVSAAEVEELLGHIDPDCGYQDWVNVLMAVHEELGPHGLAVADAWSARGSKYKKGEVARKWKGFKAGKGVSMSTLAALARDGGADLSAIARKHRGLQDDGTLPVASDKLVAKSAPKKPPVLEAANDNKPAPSSTKPNDGYPGIVSSGEFVRGFRPPDYHLDGITQTGFLYSTTAMTGTGKTAVLLLIAAVTALGLDLGGLEVKPGRVIYLAGENPDDVKMRWIAMSHHMGFDPEDIDVHFIPGAFPIPKLIERVRADVDKLGGVDMIVVDTSAAYFQGDDDNSNTQSGKHARDLRELTTLKGAPVVYVASHPVKNPDPSNLLPRGGGAFLNEVDGNLVLIKADAGVRLHWHGKHRGVNFEPISFELSTVTAPGLVDTKGRFVPTVMAAAITKGEARERATTARNDEGELLIQIEINGSRSYNDFAEALNWHNGNPRKPDKDRVVRAAAKLKRRKLADNNTGKWKLSKAGAEAAVEAREKIHQAIHNASMAAGLAAKKAS